jgi:hypothetical protein
MTSNNPFPSGENHPMKPGNKGHRKKKIRKGDTVPFERPGYGLTRVLENAGFTREMVERKVADVLLMDMNELREFKQDAHTSVFDLIVIAVAEAAIRNADTNRLDNLLDKIFGKIVRIDGNIKMESFNTNVNVPVSDADADLIARAMERALRNNV